MKYALIITVSVFLTGCNHNYSDQTEQITSLNSIDLTGTWLQTQIHDVYHSDTLEYLYSDYFESTFFITESGSDIYYSECQDYGRVSNQAIKTENYFYINSGTSRFS